MNETPWYITAACIIAAVEISYVITVICAWLGDHPTPFKFWRPYE